MPVVIGAAQAQPTSGDFFPTAPSAVPFDPAAALSITGEAAAERDTPASAFAGLAERVQVDQLLGQATTRVAIEVPPGRKGLTPRLALSYGSRGGNGLVGRGWDLRIPHVRRSTRKGVPVDWSNPSLPYVNDEFMLTLPSGTVLLDRVLGTSGVNTVYGSNTEEAMLRVWFNQSANTWTVTDTSGIRYDFGAGAASTRVGVNVAQANYTFGWGVTKITDPSGNTISYSYAAHAVSGSANGALYPSRIDYGANTNVGAYGDIFHVCFAYDATGASCGGAPAQRPDPLVSFSGGYGAELQYRVTGVKVWADGESTESSPTRRYALSYQQDALSGESRLSGVDLYAGALTLRPTTFTYNASGQAVAANASLQFFSAGSSRTQIPLRRNTINAGTWSDLIDMTADGRPDWVECDSANAFQWFIYPNLGDGQFGARQTWTGPQCGMHGYNYELADMNGDSLPDFVQTVIPDPAGTSRNWDVWYNTGSGFSAKVTWAVPPATGINYGIWQNPVNGSGGMRDLNGDTLPDAIDTYCNCNNNGVPSYCSGQEGLCRVYLGTGSAFAAPGVLWSWPRIYGVPGLSNLFETHLGRTLYSLRDMNGDSLPELVMSRPPLDPRGSSSGKCFGGNNGQTCTSDSNCGLGTCIDPTAWGVFLNTGTGFSFESICSGGSRHGLACSGGCPGGRCEDIPQYWTSPADTAGNPMDVEQACGHSNTPLAGWPPIGIEGALRDMNGDGLPDYVDANVDCDQPTQGTGWRVFINTGTDFSPTAIPWAGTAGILVQKWAAQADITQGNIVSVVAADTLDFNGDGAPDYVEPPTSSLFRIDVRYGLGPPTGALAKQENGLGGSTEIAYGLASSAGTGTAAPMCTGGTNDGQPCKYVGDCTGGTCAACTDCDHAPFPITTVSTVTTKSGLSGTGHTLSQTYRFLAPYFDWERREFRGFRWAVEEDSARGRRTETQFHQPGTSPRTPSTACGAPGQSCIDLAFARPFKGKTRYTRIRAYGTSKVHREITPVWEFSAVTDPRMPSMQSGMVLLASTEDRTWGSASATSISRKREFDQDNYGNVVEERRYDGTTLISKTTTAYQYTTASWIVDRPTTVETKNGAAQLLSRDTYSYTGQGNLSVASRYLDSNPIGSPGVTIAVATLGYGGTPGLAGQPTSITDARNSTTTIGYQDGTECDTYGLYPCTITNALSQTVRRRYKLQFGTMTEERDANDARTKLEYDAFGRLTKIFRGTVVGALPPELLPWREFSYTLGASGSPATPSRVQTRVREPGHAADFRVENRFYDGIGRFLETKGEGIVLGGTAIVRREAVGFDAAGRVATRYVPVTTAQAVDVYELPSGSGTTTVFDLLDRATQVTRPDASVRTTLYDPADIVDQRDENYIACGGQPGQVANASCPGKRVLEQRDGLDRLVNVKVYNGPTIDTETINEYDGLDRMVSTKLAADSNSTVTFTYDSFGRRIQLTEKNSGTWTYGYDAAGNLVYQGDPNANQHLEWCFDSLNRPLNKRAFTTDGYSGNNCGSGGELRTSYTYDTCTYGLGRLCQQASPARYTVARTYNARGQIGTEARTISAAGLTRTVTYGFAYDEADRLKSITYPTETDGVSELMTNSYDAGGQLSSVASTYNTYLSSAAYDVFGRSTALNLATGAGAVTEQRDYFDATGNFRLKQLAVIRGSAALQTWNFGPTNAGVISPGYDKTGNLLRIEDTTPSGQYADNSERDNDWTYTYDGLGRLTGAAWEARPTSAAFGYNDGLGNMTSGNLTFPDLTASTSVTFNRHATRPHHINWSQQPGSGTPYQYEATGAGADGNGGMTSRPATATGDMAKTILYDKEGRVTSITAGGNVVASVYDDDGMRVAKIVNGTDITFYFGRFVEVHNGTLTRHFYAGDRRIAFSPVAAPPALTLAAADADRSIMLARAPMDAQWLASLPSAPKGTGFAASAAGAAVLLVGTVVLVVIPTERRKRGLRLSTGQVAALTLLYVVSLPNWSLHPYRTTQTPRALADCDVNTPKPARIVLADHLGSTTLLTQYSDGAILEYFRYGAYGMPQAFKPDGSRRASGTELTDLTYTGQRWDALVQTYYYNARYYDPGIARFVTMDAARESPSPYSYVKWKPTGSIDPSGLLTVPETGGVSGINYIYGGTASITYSTTGAQAALGLTTQQDASRAGVSTGTDRVAQGAAASNVSAAAEGSPASSAAVPLTARGDLLATSGSEGGATPAGMTLENAVGAYAILGSGAAVAATGIVLANSALGELADAPQILGVGIALGGPAVIGGLAAGLAMTADGVLLTAGGVALVGAGAVAIGAGINDQVVVPLFGGPTFGESVSYIYSLY